jgi:hypothetical protein
VWEPHEQSSGWGACATGILPAILRSAILLVLRLLPEEYRFPLYLGEVELTVCQRKVKVQWFPLPPQREPHTPCLRKLTAGTVSTSKHHFIIFCTIQYFSSDITACASMLPSLTLQTESFSWYYLYSAAGCMKHRRCSSDSLPWSSDKRFLKLGVI